MPKIYYILDADHPPLKPVQEKHPHPRRRGGQDVVSENIQPKEQYPSHIWYPGALAFSMYSYIAAGIERDAIVVGPVSCRKVSLVTER